MYTKEKQSHKESHKSRKNHNIPSFSSTLLDEIYRSIDEKTEDFKTSKRNEEIARACLVEKWMEKASISKRKPTTLLQMQDFDNDFMFFSSTSSSNSDSSGALSSSDTEFFGSSVATKLKSSSCFSARLKPVKTGGARNHQTEKDRGPFLYDDYGNEKTVEDVIKSKSRALKIYANLKKKQPISPGGKLTNFINSLFSSNAANGKKSKGFEDSKSRKGPSTCSSASSFSRSCLSKYSQNSREKMRNGDQRTVRFHPVSVIVDEDSRPCGQKYCTYDQDSEKLHLSPPVSKTEKKQSKMQGNRKVDHIQEGGLGLKGYNGKRVDKFSVFRKIHDHENEDEGEDDEDCMSDASSDLFELDHLSLFGDKRFCEELPVYETTHFDTNRAIARGLIR